MNVVMASQDRGDYYIACVRKECGGYSAVGKKVLINGKVTSVYNENTFDTLNDAKRYARRMAKTKAKMKGYEELPEEEIPVGVAKRLEVSTDMQMSEVEMADFVNSMKGEKYVIFKDVFGIEDRFDLGVEYLAYDTEDPTILVVLDVEGKSCRCMYYRFDSVVPTEDAVSLQEIANG